MYSIFVIVTTRGDIIVREDYRMDVRQEHFDYFLSHIVKSELGSLDPHVTYEGSHAQFIRKEKLLFILISRKDVPDFATFKFLEDFHTVLKNFLGVVSEDSLSINIVLVHELMCEVIENGYVTTTDTDVLRTLVYSDPIPVKSDAKKPGLFGLEKAITPKTSANRPLVKSRSQQDVRSDEIFVDVVENLTVNFEKDGSITWFHLSGKVLIKSYVARTHSISVYLEEGVCVCKDRAEVSAYGSGIQLDSCTFDKCVDYTNFEKKQSFVVHPTQGEIEAMIYMMTSSVPSKLPFRLLTTIEESKTSKDLNLILKLNCDIPGNTKAWNINVHIPIPSITRNVMQQFSISDCSSEHLKEENKILWKMKSLPGNSEVIAKFKLVDAFHCPANKMELGPIAVEFEASNFLSSGLSVKHIKAEDAAKKPIPVQKWVRYVSIGYSYMFKIW